MKTRRRKGGKTAAKLQRVQQAMGLSNRQMAHLLQTTPRTIAGCFQGRIAAFSYNQKRQLVKLDLIAVLASRVYPEDGVRSFFAAPLADFGDKSAIDLLLEGKFNSVAKIIAATHRKQAACVTF